MGEQTTSKSKRKIQHQTVKGTWAANIHYRPVPSEVMANQPAEWDRSTRKVQVKGPFIDSYSKGPSLGLGLRENRTISYLNIIIFQTFSDFKPHTDRIFVYYDNKLVAFDVTHIEIAFVVCSLTLPVYRVQL